MRIHYWNLDTRKNMKDLKPADFQHIDEEIVAQIGKCGARERLSRIRDLAEIYRVYASRTAIMARELHDEKKYQ
jgi:hypothetical protein